MHFLPGDQEVLLLMALQKSTYDLPVKIARKLTIHDEARAPWAYPPNLATPLFLHSDSQLLIGNSGAGQFSVSRLREILYLRARLKFAGYQASVWQVSDLPRRALFTIARASLRIASRCGLSLKVSASIL
jgi:hypothetical protein